MRIKNIKNLLERKVSNSALFFYKLGTIYMLSEEDMKKGKEIDKKSLKRSF
ncbi:hypothetical protein JCM9492_05130 [Aquifex pyrophilus]